MKFTTTLLLHGKTATGFEVPTDIVEALGAGKKPPVKVTINGYTYRSSVAVMGGKFLCGVAAEHRGPAGVTAGDTVEIDLQLDTDKREVVVPDDVAKLLNANPAAKTRFEKLSHSHRRAHIEPIVAAKAADTRQRRIDRMITMLSEG
jgi:Bacteriocin-protection, YdeI or OmpD-Associated/Domain of unknown function (DUF1905)